MIDLCIKTIQHFTSVLKIDGICDLANFITHTYLYDFFAEKLAATTEPLCIDGGPVKL